MGCTLFLPLLMRAHDGGVYFEATVGEYLVDIGYSDVTAGESRTFDFALYKGVGKEKVAFDNVWVRISKDSKTIFAGPIDFGVFGQPVLTITLDSPGIYNVEANYEVAARSLATSSFSVQAFSPEGVFFTPLRLTVVGTAVIFLLTGFFIGTMSRRYAKND